MTKFDTLPIDPKDVPSDLRTKSLWIRAELIKRGYTLRGLSLANAYSINYVATALLRPLYPAELLIATALGTFPEVLWPERYDLKGHRLHATRPTKSISQMLASNAKNQEAA